MTNQPIREPVASRTILTPPSRGAVPSSVKQKTHRLRTRCGHVGSHWEHAVSGRATHDGWGSGSSSRAPDGRRLAELDKGKEASAGIPTEISGQ